MEINDRIVFSERIKGRLRQFTLDIIKLSQSLPKSEEARIVGRQVLRSGSSVYANYRASCRARSSAEFYSKLCIVVEEADETEAWLEILISSGMIATDQCKKLHAESLEILKIMSSARKKAKKP